MKKESHNIEGPKEQLSQHVKNIFKEYTTEGLHVCDIATGGGKSYTIGELTCKYYPQHFNRIIILCVQNKLVDGMNKEIDRFINEKESLIKPHEKIVIENNLEVVVKAINNGSLKNLLDEMKHQMDEIKSEGDMLRNLRSSYNGVKRNFEGLNLVIENSKSLKIKGEYVQEQINEGESKLRRSIRNFFDEFNFAMKKAQRKDLTEREIMERFSSLAIAYPQVDYKNKKVLLMTVHKAMYGIDPILSDKITIEDFVQVKRKNHNEKNGTLIIFDESDQAALAMRDALIDRTIEAHGGNKRFEKGYGEYLRYLHMIRNREYIADKYHGKQLDECIKKAQSVTRRKWDKILKGIKPYNNIFLDDVDDIETYRRGVIFSGPAFKLNISKANDPLNIFVCHKKGDKHFSLVHSKDDKSLKPLYDEVVSLDNFLSLSESSTKFIKSQFREVIMDSLNRSREEFKKERQSLAINRAEQNQYQGYPTLDREIHTFISRFEISSEFLREQEIKEFITNRKNISIHDDDNKNAKFPDNTVYFQGFQLYQEELDEKDNQHRVRISCRELSTTAEKILYNLANTPKTTVVLCSATASSPTVVSNFDTKHIKFILGDKYKPLPKEDRERFDELMSETYHKEHKIEIVPLKNHPAIDENVSFKEKYRDLFHKDAIAEGYVDGWYKCTNRELRRKRKNDDEDITYKIDRIFQFIEAYKFFYDHGDIHSMLFFQNRTGYESRDQFHVISCLIDGSYKDQASLDKLSDPKDWEALPNDWTNEHLRITKNIEDVENDILEKLGKDKDAKIMLVAAYNSFKAGTNLQYKIPEGLDYLRGDSWEKEDERKKDWDAICLQCPTAYMMLSDESNDTYEKALYKVVLNLMMLYERGYLSRQDVKYWLYNALCYNLKFSDKNHLGVRIDKSAWVQNIIEQATGRICRTRNKPHTTYILFDYAMVQYFDNVNMEKSMTKEYKTLVDFILRLPSEEMSTDDPKEFVRCNNANEANRQLSRIRSMALHYNTLNNKSDEDEINEAEYEDFDSGDGKRILHYVDVSQKMIESFKKTIIKKPVITSLEELEEVDRKLSFIDKCYGDWKRNENQEYSYRYETFNKKCIIHPNNDTNCKIRSISPSYVRLDVLMKNKVIKDYFEKNGYATDWELEGLILHPQILGTDYAGEIGEEAFKAIVLHYTGCTEDRFVHLQGKDYEEADFVVLDPDGSYKIAFDVKNMNPNFRHDDRLGDMPTSEKRKIKKEKLGCEVIVVNMLEMEESIDRHEITGVIDSDGEIIPTAIETLKTLING